MLSEVGQVKKGTLQTPRLVSESPERCFSINDNFDSNPTMNSHIWVIQYKNRSETISTKKIRYNSGIQEQISIQLRVYHCRGVQKGIK